MDHKEKLREAAERISDIAREIAKLRETTLFSCPALDKKLYTISPGGNYRVERPLKRSRI